MFGSVVIYIKPRIAYSRKIKVIESLIFKIIVMLHVYLYADLQVYHVCENGRVLSSELSPNGTISNQRAHVCDWWYDLTCLRPISQTRKNPRLLLQIFKHAGPITDQPSKMTNKYKLHSLLRKS